MVRYSYRTLHSLLAGFVQPGDALGIAALPQGGHSHPANYLVSQVAGHFRRCPGRAPFLFMEPVALSDLTRKP
jgi:hypothetical protein